MCKLPVFILKLFVFLTYQETKGKGKKKKKKTWAYTFLLGSIWSDLSYDTYVSMYDLMYIMSCRVRPRKMKIYTLLAYPCNYPTEKMLFKTYNQGASRVRNQYFFFLLYLFFFFFFDTKNSFLIISFCFFLLHIHLVWPDDDDDDDDAMLRGER